jgi:hypothetical protein
VERRWSGPPVTWKRGGGGASDEEGGGGGGGAGGGADGGGRGGASANAFIGGRQKSAAPVRSGTEKASLGAIDVPLPVVPAISAPRVARTPTVRAYVAQEGADAAALGESERIPRAASGGRDYDDGNDDGNDGGNDGGNNGVGTTPERRNGVGPVRFSRPRRREREREREREGARVGHPRLRAFSLREETRATRLRSKSQTPLAA